MDQTSESNTRKQFDESDSVSRYTHATSMYLGAKKRGRVFAKAEDFNVRSIVRRSNLPQIMQTE